MNHLYSASFKNIDLLPLSGGDIEALRIWRNDKRQIRFLRDVGHISAEMQRKWFENYLNDQKEIIFGIHDRELGCLVGSVSLYAIDQEQNVASIGKIQIGDEREHGRGIGRLSLVMAMKIGFRLLGLRKIVGSVHPDNVQAYTNDMKVGFFITGECDSVAGGKEKLIEIDENRAAEVNQYYRKIVIKDLSRNDWEFYLGKEGMFSKTITEADVYNFAGITGDLNPLHVDAIEAADSVFGRRVAHGMLVSSLFSTVIGTSMPGKGTIYLSQECKFLKPVYFGDTISAYVRVLRLLENRRAELLTEAYNQSNVQVISGTAKVILPGRWQT